MYTKLIRKHGWLLTGLAVAFVAGCHDDDKKVRYHHDRPEARHTDANVGVAVGPPEHRAYAEPAPPPDVITEGGQDVIVERPPREVVVEPPPREVIVEQPPETVVINREPVVIVQQPPPAVIVERRPPPPPGLTIWIGGYWHVEGHRFVWIGGHYEREHKGHHYVQPRWERSHRGWEFHRGRWD